MTRLKLVIFLAGLIGLLSSCKEQIKEKSKDMATASVQFKVGQVWKYNNRPGEDSSTLTILKTEKYENDTIIHIRVDGIKLHNPSIAGGYSDFIGHLPFSQNTISKSVTRLVEQNNNLPDFSEGYNQWKEAWDSGKGGYWTVDLKDAIEGMDSVMRQNK
ncbi:hypothetical protein [Niastella populi]|nr:hypothetical protein [Niastella populi]